MDTAIRMPNKEAEAEQPSASLVPIGLDLRYNSTGKAILSDLDWSGFRRNKFTVPED